MTEKIICPNCYKEMSILIDEWGRTPWHIHCFNCKIDIGITYPSKVFDFLDQIKPDTWIEYYNNAIQILYEKNIMKINKEIG